MYKFHNFQKSYFTLFCEFFSFKAVLLRKCKHPYRLNLKYVPQVQVTTLKISEKFRNKHTWCSALLVNLQVFCTLHNSYSIENVSTATFSYKLWFTKRTFCQTKGRFEQFTKNHLKEYHACSFRTGSQQDVEKHGEHNRSYQRDSWRKKNKEDR